MGNKEEIKKTLTTDKIDERDSNLSEFNERFGDPIIKVKGEVNPDYSVANNPNFCDKGWHNGDCCCNCANHIEDFYHCTTVERKEGEGCVCSKHKGWICLVSFDGEKTIAHSNWAEHGFCELHVKKIRL